MKIINYFLEKTGVAATYSSRQLRISPEAVPDDWRERFILKDRIQSLKNWVSRNHIFRSFRGNAALSRDCQSWTSFSTKVRRASSTFGRPDRRLLYPSGPSNVPECGHAYLEAASACRDAGPPDGGLQSFAASAMRASSCSRGMAPSRHMKLVSEASWESMMKLFTILSSPAVYIRITSPLSLASIRSS